MAAQVVRIDQNARFFSDLNTLITVTAGVFTAADLQVNKHVNYQPGDYVGLAGLLLNKNVRLPLVGPIALALANRLPDFIDVTIEDIPDTPVVLQHNFEGDTLRSIITAIFHPMAVNYFEKHKTALSAKFGTDRTGWPQAWQMGWLVRNGLSHGNQVHFERPNSTSVTWQGLTLSPADNGRQLVFGLLNQADLLLLVFEMEETLFLPLARRAA